jgi:hypothetical protein
MSARRAKPRPDVEIACVVRARAIRFKVVPETRVWFDGEPGATSKISSDRQNLPDRVQPGRTYRNVTVRWRAQTWIG